LLKNSEIKNIQEKQIKFLKDYKNYKTIVKKTIKIEESVIIVIIMDGSRLNFIRNKKR
jgi:hypothetical protein